jgi:hypothetical protein
MATQRIPKLSRSAFCLIAQTIRELPATDTTEVNDVVRHSAIVARFADVLAGTNPRFNRSRFENACNGREVTRA